MGYNPNSSARIVSDIVFHLNALADDPRNPIAVTLGIWAACILVEVPSADLGMYATVGEFFEAEQGPDGEPYYEAYEALALDLYWKYLVAAFPTAQDPDCEGLLNPAVIVGLDSHDVNEWMFSGPVLDMAVSACLETHRAAAMAMIRYAECDAAMSRAQHAIGQAQRRAKADGAIDYLQATVGTVRWDKTNWWRLLDVMAQAEKVFGHAAISAALSFVRLKTSATVADELRARYRTVVA